MPLWGKSDASTNAAIFAPSQVNKTPNTNNAAALYNNTTPNAYFSGATVGLYGVSAAEVSATGTSVAEVTITFAGSGYTANASANATGRISAVNIVGAGSGYTSNPSVAIAAPAALTFSGNSTGVVVGNSTSKGFILLGAANVAVLANGDAVTYLVAASNTAIGGLANNTTYYVTVANSTAIQVSSDAEDQVGGVYINLSSVAATAQAGHSLTGQTATATSSLSGGKNKGVLAGWNLRTVGSGGRAGRVQYECLVAMRNIASDGSDDAKLPDA